MDMELGVVFNGLALDIDQSPLPEAKVTVKGESGDCLSLFYDRNGKYPVPNPFTAGKRGYVGALYADISSGFEVEVTSASGEFIMKSHHIFRR